ncbi:MAG: flagellar hook-basal body protein [Oscillospiraceae bacterium]|jgi:flagellar basal body rod protein FlgG
MLRGFYITANSMINQQRTIDTISNNIANSMTPGYKADSSVKNTFKKELILLADGKTSKGGTFEYKFTESTKTSLEQGSFEYTERPLDVAIQGPVYFNLSTDDGNTLLTRNGQFSIDGEGYLYLPGGGRVLGENGEINVGTSDFVINEKGEITVDGNVIDTLELTYIEDDADIQKSGDNTFIRIVEEGEEQLSGEIPEDIEFSIIQGAYECSNVDISIELTKAMEAQRSFEALSQALKMIDTINQRAVSELGKM